MTIEKKLLGTNPSGDKPNVADVFSTYLYTGNGSTQTITNGIDIAGEGGMVWLKCRDVAYQHGLFDTERGTSNALSSSYTGATQVYSGVTAFTSDGFSVGSYNGINQNTKTFASWTFRKAPKFFDLVKYTGNGVAGRQIAHELGVAPGMFTIKTTSHVDRWWTYHKSTTATKYLWLDDTKVATTLTSIWNNTEPTNTVFTVGSSGNEAGKEYVAYLFADNTAEDADEQMIKCGSFNQISGSVAVDVGFTPQYVLVKNANNPYNYGGGWYVFDTQRGYCAPNGSSNGVGSLAALLYANTTAYEDQSSLGGLTTNGFVWASNFAYGTTPAATYIYMAIRAPMMKEPESGTEVFNSIARTGTGGTISITGAGFAPDFLISVLRDTYGGSGVFDRLRLGQVLYTETTTDEGANTSASSFDMDGFTATSSVTYTNDAGHPYVYSMWKRAKGFFDVVAYTGNGVAGRTVAHSLGVVPEMMIVKKRSSAANWYVYHAAIGATKYSRLNLVDTPNIYSAVWNDTTPVETSLTLGVYDRVNGSGSTFIAYLFASLDGVSKVGSYTGNGSSQTINCGFAAGARFIMIKRTDATGDWFMWDTTRGIVAGNDPHLSLNTTAAEVTSDDSIDPASSGFGVNQVAATNINVSSGTYIFYAIA